MCFLCIDKVNSLSIIYLQEEMRGEDEVVELPMHLQAYSSFGEDSFLCNTPHPYTIRVRELCRVLRLDKHSFTEILDIYFLDGRIILNNFLEVIYLAVISFLEYLCTTQSHFTIFCYPQGKDSNLKSELLKSDITLYIEKSELVLASRLNCATYEGDIFWLERLIGAGADPNNTDYDGRSPLVLF